MANPFYLKIPNAALNIVAGLCILFDAASTDKSAADEMDLNRCQLNRAMPCMPENPAFRNAPCFLNARE